MQFQSFRKILRSFQLSKSRIPCSHLNGLVKHLGALLSREDSNKLSVASVRTSGNTSRSSSVFKKNPNFICRHRSRKIACNRLDSRAISSKCGLNIETHEVRYGKAVAQFTVWTLFASVWMLPREIRISGYVEALLGMYYLQNSILNSLELREDV
jgi:hypothetical protein